MASTQTVPARPDMRPTSKSIPTLVQELWELVVAYARQETVEPLKGLARFIGFGVGGSLLVGFGVVLLLLAGLRALQEEAASTFDGNWSWVPYVCTLAAAGIVVGLAVWAVGRGKRKD